MPNDGLPALFRCLGRVPVRHVRCVMQWWRGVPWWCGAAVAPRDGYRSSVPGGRERCVDLRTSGGRCRRRRDGQRFRPWRSQTLCASAYFVRLCRASRSQSADVTTPRSQFLEVTGLRSRLSVRFLPDPARNRDFNAAAAGNRDLGRLARCSRRLWFRARTMRPKTLWRYFAGLEGSAGDTHNGFVCGGRGRSGGPGTSRTGAVRRCRGQ